MSEATCAIQPAYPRQPSPTRLRALLLLPQQDAPSRDLEKTQKFSWLRCVFSIFSYLLMLSDVPRTGFGVHDLSFYDVTEPDHLIFFGPYAYPVTKQLLKNETTTGATRFWPYKYDSTSVAMRAVVSHLKIPEWPACVTYDATCDELSGIPRATLFRMIDSLIEAVKTRDNKHQPHGEPGRLTLRVDNEWSDRLHNYAFPWFFFSTKRRTIQATYYDVDQLAAQRVESLCSSSSRRRRWPLTCGDSLTNFGRICPSTTRLCRDVGSVHSHVPARLYHLLEKFPNHTMDFVLLEGVDDLTRASLSSQGYKNLDIVALARVRKCDIQTTSGRPRQCETTLVDDFRYELVSHVTNVRQWFWVTATLRGIGQLYAWMRLVFLLVGSYFARAREPRMQQRSYFDRAVLTLRTVFLLPSQVMVYGSLFPISCYLLAHSIDAAIVYDINAVKFITIMGVMALEVGEILRICAVSMRSLWLLAFVCHILHRIATRCAWSPIHGVPGVPEFSLSFVASLTILAQIRYPSLRNARVLSVEELVPSTTRYYCNNRQSDSIRGFIYKLVFGSLIDYKCLAVAVFVQIGVVLLLRLVHRVIPRWFKYESVLLSRTIVPFSAGALWPRSALVVSWNGTFLAKPPLSEAAKTASPPRVEPESVSTVVVVAVKQPHAIVAQSSQQCRRASHRLHHFASRSHDDKALIFMMNLAMMTDPLTFLWLRVFRGHHIGVFTIMESSSDNQRDPPSRYRDTTLLLLPLALCSDLPVNWSKLRLQNVVHTSELDWCDLLQCG